MAPEVLILGGSSFVGRALVEDALARGWRVTTFNRGRGRWADPRAERLTGDRLDAATLAPLGRRSWDLVVDTWAGAPRAARDSAAVLAGAAARYAYISSGSVYAPPPPIGADESAPTVEGDPGAAALPGGEPVPYPEAKRGAEVAITEAFGDRALLARAGLILGPHEDVGRLPWWLHRMARGGEVLAPGPPGLPLQYVDARDLARCDLDAAMAGESGPFNVVSRRGHATMNALLEACRAAVSLRSDQPPTAPPAHLKWVDADAILAAGIEPWTELPIWLPPDHEYAGLHAANVERAHAAGLRCRPVEETVADTWSWLSSLDGPPPLRPDLPPPGLDAAREGAVLDAWAAGRRARA
jgi:nucleoside-diphosphate-sugar epimerase